MNVKLVMNQDSIKSSAVKVKTQTVFINGEENEFASFVDTAYIPHGVYEELEKDPEESVVLTFTDEEPEDNLLYQEMVEERETKNTRVLNHNTIYLDGEALSSLAVGIRGIYVQKDSFDKAFDGDLWLAIS